MFESEESEFISCAVQAKLKIPRLRHEENLANLKKKLDREQTEIRETYLLKIKTHEIEALKRQNNLRDQREREN